MRRAADVLYLLATFSIRTNFLDKALIYAKSGYQLFSADSRMVEIYAYTLLLKGDYVTADEVLQSTTKTSRNLLFLRTRTAIVLGRPENEIQATIRAYLQFN